MPNFDDYTRAARTYLRREVLNGNYQSRTNFAQHAINTAVGAARAASVLGKRKQPEKEMPRFVTRNTRRKRRPRPYKRKRTIKRKQVRRKTRKYKTRRYSTKGFQLVDKEYYAFSLATSSPIVGHSAATTFEDKFIWPYVEYAGNTGTWTPYFTAGASTSSQHVGGRIGCTVESFATTSGILEHFNKFKVNWIKFKFRFPDQAAATSNAGFPLFLHINYGDKYRIQFDNDGVGKSADGQGEINEFLERPGWKTFNLKRLNNFTVVFKPTHRVVDELGINNSTARELDVGKMKASRWMNVEADKTVMHWGPTIVFQTPSAATGAPVTKSDVFGTSSFLQYSFCEVTCSISMKDRTQEADD